MGGGSCVFQDQPGSPGSNGASPYQPSCKALRLTCGMTLGHRLGHSIKHCRIGFQRLRSGSTSLAMKHRRRESHGRGFLRFPRSAGKPRFGRSLSLPALRSGVEPCLRHDLGTSPRHSVKHCRIGFQLVSGQAALHSPCNVEGGRVMGEGSCVFQDQPESPGSDGASPYHTSSLYSSSLFEMAGAGIQLE
jgi:hypothetical protein